jgi:hypothetical protein
MGDSGKGCAYRFFGCFAAVLVIVGAAGAFIYFKAPNWWQRFDEGVAPWVAGKVRVFMGRVALRPLTVVIEESELSSSEQKEWANYLETCWEESEYWKERTRFREAMIKASRRTVLTPAGLYYALQHISKDDFSETTLTPRQLDGGKKLVARTMSGLLDGVYGPEELQSLEQDLYSVLVGSRISTTNKQGQWETDNNLRDFFRTLLALQRAPVHHGTQEALNPAEALPWDLEIFKQQVEAARPTD